LSMKKGRVFLIVSLCMTLIVISGCGKSRKSHSDIPKSDDEEYGMEIVDDTNKNVNILDIVDLGDYKNLKLNHQEKKVTNSDVERAVADALQNTQIVDEGAESGDWVFASFTGQVDGTIISDESNEGMQFKIGESGMPFGFDESIIGLKPGESKDIDLQLPDEYKKNPDLSGKKITYSIIVNSITRSYPELTEDWIHKYTEYSSKDEYKSSVRENLIQEASLNQNDIDEEEFWEKIKKTCIIEKYIKTDIDSAKKQFDLNMNNNLQMSGIDLDTYKSQMKLNDKEYEKQKINDIKRIVEQDMIIRAISKKEGFKIDDEKSKEVIMDMANEYQMTEQSFRSLFKKKDLEKQVMRRRVIDLIAEN